MDLVALGLNHRSAPLAIRERFAFEADKLEGALHDLVGESLAQEAAIVSTCNRTEIYCATPDAVAVSRWLARYRDVEFEGVRPYFYQMPGARAVDHAFRVASGLESMVLGEPQILGQIKQAVKAAEHAGTLGTLLHKLFQRSFTVAKEVRSRTDIGASSVSLAAAAVRIAERIFTSVSEQSVLFVGAGEMIELCATHFCSRSPRRVSFANRTVERAYDLANRFSGESLSLAELADVLAMSDIVITCTASPLPIIGKGMIERALKARRHRPILVVDLAVPRDVEPEVGELDDVFLYTVDDLGKIVKEGLDLRQSALKEAESIVARGVEEFMEWLSAREAVPAIRAFRTQAEDIRQKELERALKALARGEDPTVVLDSMSLALTNKFLHGPTHALQGAKGEARDQLIGLLSRSFFGTRTP